MCHLNLNKYRPKHLISASSSDPQFSLSHQSTSSISAPTFSSQKSRDIFDYFFFFPSAPLHEYILSSIFKKHSESAQFFPSFVTWYSN